MTSPVAMGCLEISEDNGNSIFEDSNSFAVKGDVNIRLCQFHDFPNSFPLVHLTFQNF